MGIIDNYKMEKERRGLKRLILILGGIILVLVSAIFILYKNNQSSNSKVVDIIKEDDDLNKEDKEKDTSEEKKGESLKKIYVDIKGMVVNPGVYEVDSTVRVSDVIELAGGLLPDADTSLINLAKIVKDEMTIIIYSSEETREKYKEELCSVSAVMQNDALVTDSDNSNDNNSSDSENKLVNINTASVEEFLTLDGIGEAKAKAIVSYRSSNGNFKSIEDIKNVSGIGDALFEKIKAYITV